MSQSNERVVLVITQFGQFIGVLKEGADPFTIKEPCQIVPIEVDVPNPQGDDGVKVEQQATRKVQVPTPIYLEMPEMSFINTPLAYGDAPSKAVQDYRAAVAKAKGIAVASPDDLKKLQEMAAKGQIVDLNSKLKKQ